MPRYPRTIFSPILHPPPAILCPHLPFFFIYLIFHFPCRLLCSLSFTVPTSHSASISHSVSSVPNPSARFAMLSPPFSSSPTLCPTRHPCPHPHPHALSTMLSALSSILLPPHSGDVLQTSCCKPESPRIRQRSTVLQTILHVLNLYTTLHQTHFLPRNACSVCHVLSLVSIPLTHNLSSYSIFHLHTPLSIPNLQSPSSPSHLPLYSLHTVSILCVSSHTRKHHTSCSILSAHPSTPQPLTCYLLL